MASGKSCIIIHNIQPPATLMPATNVRAGGSTPAERVPIWQFDAATIEYLDFYCQLSGYDGGGLTFTLPWMASSATSGATRWGIAIRRIQDDAEDVDTAHTYDYNDVDATTASAAGEVKYTTITFTNGADMDSWAEGEFAIVRVRRNASHANDNMTGDAELLGLYGAET